jgi:hypothetical protein
MSWWALTMFTSRHWYSTICDIWHLWDQRLAGYRSFLDIRILCLCVSLCNYNLMDRRFFAFIVSSTVPHLPAPSMTKMKYSWHCTVTLCNRWRQESSWSYHTTLSDNFVNLVVNRDFHIIQYWISQILLYTLVCLVVWVTAQVHCYW